MKLLLLVALVGAASAFVEQNEWAAFKAKHGKSYSNPIEEFRRMKIYADNKAFVDQHQKEFAAGLHTFQVALNKFADLTTEEWSKTFKGYIQREKGNRVHQHSGKPRQIERDWRALGAVTGVKDQGHCGSCWAFSTTGSLEGQWQIKNHELLSFSEQQLVDCSTENDGCDGGLQDRAFRYIIKNMGIELESDYPYTAKDGRCKADKSLNSGIMYDYTDVLSEESELEDAVSTVGPIAVGIDANHASFQLYSEGVYNEPECSSYKLDHGVLVVGYGEDEIGNGGHYWIVKNSWGYGWGDSGYIKMAKDKDNQCGIATQASYPVVVV